MLVGEGPGRQEDREGRPFVGSAGRVLNGWLALAKLSRQDLYITNVVKSHPTNKKGGSNRPPQPHEVAACWDWLEQQLAILRPAVVVTLGAHSLAAFAPQAKLSLAHGRPLPQGKRTIFPLYHPSYALRQNVPRQTFEADALKLRVLLERIGGLA